MTSSTDLEREVDEILSKALRADADEFDDGTALGPAGLDAESLDVIEMAETVEMELGVEIPDEDLHALDTVGDVKRYVAERH